MKVDMLILACNSLVASISNTPESKFGLVLYWELLWYTGKWVWDTEKDTGLEGTVQIITELIGVADAYKSLSDVMFELYEGYVVVYGDL